MSTSLEEQEMLLIVNRRRLGTALQGWPFSRGDCMPAHSNSSTRIPTFFPATEDGVK
jgi:hypothetical protein